MGSFTEGIFIGIGIYIGYRLVGIVLSLLHVHI